ncbi:MAG: DNA repair protein RecN, partial [Herbaspirillum sp.]
RERLEWQVSELDKLALQPGEWNEVSNEHSRLSHAASLIDGAQEGLTVLSESESSGSEQALLSQLSALNLKLSRLAEIDVSLKSVLELLEPAQIQMQEAVYALNDYLSRMELDPARLREVEARLEAIHSTARKYHMAPDDLPQELASLSAQLRQLADVSDLDGLRAQEKKLQADYLALAHKLSKARAKSAERLALAVSAAMQELSMAGGSFAIALNPCEAASYGLEQVEFLVAGHAGVVPRPLAKVASGGELARIALAISVITATTGANHVAGSKPATLIFDEVDSGIGGAVAEIVGRLLKKLGQERQVLCVTHLPQVASQANQHFQVSKSSHDGKTVSHITLLDQKSRVEEIARMLGGLEITSTTRKHARELLAS